MVTLPGQALQHVPFVTDTTYSLYTTASNQGECRGPGGALLSLDLMLGESVSAHSSLSDKDQGVASVLCSDPSRGEVSCPQPLFASSLCGTLAVSPTSVFGGLPSSQS